MNTSILGNNLERERQCLTSALMGPNRGIC